MLKYLSKIISEVNLRILELYSELKRLQPQLIRSKILKNKIKKFKI